MRPTIKVGNNNVFFNIVTLFDRKVYLLFANMEFHQLEILININFDNRKSFKLFFGGGKGQNEF